MSNIPINSAHSISFSCDGTLASSVVSDNVRLPESVAIRLLNIPSPLIHAGEATIGTVLATYVFDALGHWSNTTNPVEMA